MMSFKKLILNLTPWRVRHPCPTVYPNRAIAKRGFIDNDPGFGYNNVTNDVEFDIKKGMT